MKAILNGQEIDAEAGETILQAARRTGHYIPTLCELADINHTPGTCRVCLVEILRKGADESLVATACTTPIEEGMEIKTRTKHVRDMQRLQVELLLADHNQDCATCVRHGDCELQDVAQFVGLTESRFGNDAEKHARQLDKSSPAMTRDMNKCVRCLRCVDVCRLGQAVDALEITGTGSQAQIGLRHGVAQAESDCVTCGQCIMVCPTGALAERDDIETVMEYLYDDDVTTVFQFAPALRVGFGEEFGLPAGTNVEGQIIAALRKLGADIVLDTNFGADIVVMEEGTELLERLAKGMKPNFTSCCPSWVNFAERHYPAILPHLSTTKSPQQVLGAVAKSYLPIKMGLDPKKMRVISIMPCVAKKDERLREQLRQGDQYEIDAVLTVREFARLLKREGIDLKALAPETFDNPYMGGYSGAGAIFGTTGGVVEAAVRTMYALVNGRELEGIEVTALRGFENTRTATVELGGSYGTIKLAMCHGLKDTRRIVEEVLAGRADFDIIEIMACPGGCVDGGGHLRSKKAYLPHAKARREALYAVDRKAKVRQSHNNEEVKALYRDFLGKPHSELAEKLLHTSYSDRSGVLRRSMKDVWKEVSELPV